MQQNANQITVEQAIQLISNVIAQYRGTLQEHQAIQQAIQVIITEIKKNEQETQG